MRKILFLLPFLLLFSCKKDKINVPSDEIIKVECFSDQIEEGESVTVDIIYQLKGEDEKSNTLEMSVYQGVLNTEVGLNQLSELKSLSLNYETSDQLRIWHRISNMDESEVYEEISPTDLHNSSMQFNYTF